MQTRKLNWFRRWSRVVPVAVVAMGMASFGMPAGADAATGYCYGYPATISGSGVIWGTAGNDVIVGSDIQDNINGLGGNDIICGRGGNDIISGSAGNDRILGDLGDDALYGHEGNDRTSGGPGDDQLFGHAGDDFLNGNEGNDRITGNDGNDQLIGEYGNDHLDGGGGDDNLYDILHNSSVWPFSNRILGQGGFDRCSYWTYEYMNNAWQSAQNLFSTCESYNPTSWTGSSY